LSAELNRGYPEPDEPELIAQMVKLVVERMEPQGGCMRRGQHAKPTGCVRAMFAIRNDVPEDLRHGVFRQPGQSYSAVVRFSNSLERIAPDGKGSARGLAIKLLGVSGTPALGGAPVNCQDFLTVNSPLFPMPLLRNMSSSSTSGRRLWSVIRWPRPGWRSFTALI
jgi:hypothetical protein